MVAMGGKARCETPGLQCLQHAIDFGLTENRLPKRLYIANEANAPGHVGRHSGLERAAPNKRDDRMQVRGADTQSGFQRFQVFVVLPKGVLEFETAPGKFLRPLRLLLCPENPAAHVLRFQHENAMDREEYMIDLRGTVRCIQGDVMQAAIGVPVQSPVRKDTHQQLADMPFGPR